MVSIALAFDATAGSRRRIPLATRNSSTLDQTDTQTACVTYLPPTRACYDTSNGGGDCITWITGNYVYAFVAFPYIPDGLLENIYFAKIPLSMM